MVLDLDEIRKKIDETDRELISYGSREAGGCI